VETEKPWKATTCLVMTCHPWVAACWKDWLNWVVLELVQNSTRRQIKAKAMVRVEHHSQCTDRYLKVLSLMLVLALVLVQAN